jgi:hypothetical protein
MTELDSIVRHISAECYHDYVGIWEVAREIIDRGGATVALNESITSIVELVLRDPNIQIGKFYGGVFERWPGGTEERMLRLREELALLGRAPGIGDVAWLTALAE